MCGITGAAAGYGQQVPPVAVARRMCAVIRHRGPDDEGVFHSAQAFLGMRRLAIIDPAGGEQPVYNETRDVCAVVNGEIYNYRELRRRLERLGHVFRSGSDIECVVHAYEEYGIECFGELRGMFAIALWDARKHSLVLARDRFGKKPLFYTETAQGLFFASELKSLLLAPGVDNELNRAVIPDYLLLGYVPTPESIIAGVRKLRPGHHLVFHEGRTSIGSYWNLRYTPKLDYEERSLTDILERQLDSAVAIRLRSDVPFGAFLSGGIDSSLVVALMTRHLDEPVKTFSIGFEETEFNEAADARRVAEHLGTEHRELLVRPDAAALLDDIAWYLDEPLADSSAIPTYIVSMLAARYVKMVLTGDGGDEMFAGYERYARYRQLLAMKHAGLARLSPLLQTMGGALSQPAGARLARVGARLALQHPDDYLAGVALTTPARLHDLLDGHGNGAGAVSRNYGKVRGCFMPRGETLGELDTVLYGDVLSYLLDDILVKVDRMSMANSLETRAPLLDHQLAEFAARLPERCKLRGTTGKYLLKRVAARYLPESCVQKKKQGFAIPLARWLRTDLREPLLDMLDSGAFRNRGAFNVAAARGLALEHMRGTHDHAETLWAMLVFETWARRFLDAPAAAYLTPGIVAVAGKTLNVGGEG